MEVDGVEAWVNVGLDPQDDVRLEEENEDCNQRLKSKQAINYLDLSLGHRKKCAAWDENYFSGIGNDDLPEEGIVIESNVEESVIDEKLFVIKLVFILS